MEYNRGYVAAKNEHRSEIYYYTVFLTFLIFYYSDFIRETPLKI